MKLRTGVGGIRVAEPAGREFRPTLACIFCVVLLLAAAAPASAAPVSFTDPINLPIAQGGESVTVSDFNRDSDPDLAVGTSGGVAILLGASGESFTGPTDFRASIATYRSVAVGDFDGNSNPDLAVTSETDFLTGAGSVSILLGDGTGGFSPRTKFTTGGDAASVAVGDFNADSDPDLAVANFSSDNVSILLGSTGGSFTGPTNFAAGSRPTSVGVGDFNGDSDPDLAVVSYTYPEPGIVSILLGGANASFGGPTGFPVGGRYSRSVAVGDFNADSDPDLAVANSNVGDGVSILVGAASGSFTGPTDFAAGRNPSWAAVGDFNGDSRPDLAVANLTSEDVSLLLNDAGAPQLTDTDPRSPANANSPRVKGTADAGSTVRIYKAPTSADCTPANLLATGTAAALASPGLLISVPDNSSTLLRATATVGGRTSACSRSSITYVEDSARPDAPSLTATNPGSPANDNFPRVRGAAEADSMIHLYRALAPADCVPANLLATGTAADLVSPGLQLSVPIADNSNNFFRATATDLAGNRSGCSTIYVNYVEDSAAPVPPSLVDTEPESPANDRTPLVKGVAEAGSTVRLYTAPTDADCTPSSLEATGTATEFASPGLPASVPDNSTTTFRATATDAAGNTSACSSSSIIYVEDSGGFAGPPGPVSPRVATDKAPTLTLGSPSSERIGRQGRLYVLVRCDEACTVSAFATASVGQASKVFRTGKVTRSLAAGKRVRLRLKFSKKATHAIRRALARHKRVTAKVAVTTRDGAGNASSGKRTIRLRT